jgi:hypothetical protein
MDAAAGLAAAQSSTEGSIEGLEGLEGDALGQTEPPSGHSSVLAEEMDGNISTSR